MTTKMQRTLLPSLGEKLGDKNFKKKALEKAILVQLDNQYLPHHQVKNPSTNTNSE
jgi:hypothetical protein